MAVDAPTRMTTEEMLALPDNGTERWLIRGELRERLRQDNAWGQAEIAAGLVRLLRDWNEVRPCLAGEVVGKVGCRLRRDPDSTIGIDAAWAPRDLTRDASGLLAGPPVLAVHVLAAWDLVGDGWEKVDEYLDGGVRLAWVVHPRRRTVTIYRPGRPVEQVNASQELSGDPELPGFRVAVARLFP